jgi:hypothetical protein|tara:strand:- start:394 stop:642 length:249 start_codon:yes stop_codon:yes gene_type:complete
MPGIFLRYLTDENQHDWVDDFADIQPKMDFEINWNKDRVNAPTEEQLVDMFTNWIRTTRVTHQPKQTQVTSELIEDLPDPEE